MFLLVQPVCTLLSTLKLCVYWDIINIHRHHDSINKGATTLLALTLLTAE